MGDVEKVIGTDLQWSPDVIEEGLTERAADESTQRTSIHDELLATVQRFPAADPEFVFPVEGVSVIPGDAVGTSSQIGPVFQFLQGGTWSDTEVSFLTPRYGNE